MNSREGAKCKKDPVNLFCLCGAELLTSDERKRGERVLQLKLEATTRERPLRCRLVSALSSESEQKQALQVKQERYQG